MPSILCTDLRVEHLREPLAVDTAAPRFSWIPENGKQASFEIEVRDVADLLIWSSGCVDSAESVLVQYQGKPLASNASFTWRVRAWGKGEPSPGDWAASCFGTGLLTSVDWQALWVMPPQKAVSTERWSMLDWITGRRPEGGPEERLRPVQLLRQEFGVRDGLVRARVFATARGCYSLRINGAQADDQVLAPGFDSYTHRLSAQCYDITGLLDAGANVLGVALSDGWWAGRIGLTGSSAQWDDKVSAIWQVHLDYADGSQDVVASGPGVRCTPGPWLYADLFVGEHYDHRADPTGWDNPEFDDTSWLEATPSARSTEIIVPFSGEPVRRVAELSPIAITGSMSDGIIVDFGQVIAGRVRLTLPQTQNGQRVSIEHTETLDATGEWFVNIEGINKDQTDVYIASGASGGETFEPTFTFHGFRYARLRGLGKKPDPADVTAVVISSDLETTGGFKSSDDRLNRLHQNVVWSQRGNFLSVPTDCPQRERAGWTGDIAVFAPAATNNARVASFLTRWLRNLRADQLADGRIPIYSPRSPFDIHEAETGQGLGAIVSAAGWSDAIAVVPWTLYERYGDKRVLEENYESMCRWIDYQRTAAEQLPPALTGSDLSPERHARQALLYNAGEHFGDWLTPSTLAGRPLHEAIGVAPALTSELVAPMLQAQTLTIAARIAAVLGRTADQEDFNSRAAAVRKAFCDEYLDHDGKFPVQLQGVYVLAIAYRMVHESLMPALGRHLAELVSENGNRLDTGFLSTPHLLDALWDTGHRSQTRELLWQTEMPSWLYPVDRGATSIWESWDAIADDGTARTVSLNHYALGCVDDWLFRRIAGIKSTSPGYRTLVIEPDFECGLTEVQAHIDTPYGRVAVKWKRDNDTVELEATVPAAIATATLVGNAGDLLLPPGKSLHHLSVTASALA